MCARRYCLVPRCPPLAAGVAVPYGRRHGVCPGQGRAIFFLHCYDCEMVGFLLPHALHSQAQKRGIPSAFFSLFPTPPFWLQLLYACADPSCTMTAEIVGVVLKDLGIWISGCTSCRLLRCPRDAISASASNTCRPQMHKPHSD